MTEINDLAEHIAAEAEDLVEGVDVPEGFQVTTGSRSFHDRAFVTISICEE